MSVIKYIFKKKLKSTSFKRSALVFTIIQIVCLILYKDYRRFVVPPGAFIIFLSFYLFPSIWSTEAGIKEYSDVKSSEEYKDDLKINRRDRKIKKIIND
jgi:hypothetical protein